MLAIVHGHGRASTVSVSGAFSITRWANARHDSQSDATVAGCDDASQCSTPQESLRDRETRTNRVLNCYWMRSSVKPLSFATLAVICTLGDGLPLTSSLFSLVTIPPSRPPIGRGIHLEFSGDAWVDPRKDPPCNDNYPVTPGIQVRRPL